MGAFVVPVVFVLMVVAVGVVATRRFSRRTVAQSDRLQASDRPTLRYVVPPGQDPALVVAALAGDGFDVSPDSEPGPSSPIVIIGTSGAKALDREDVRRALARLDESNVNPHDSAPVDRPPVRFTDE